MCFTLCPKYHFCTVHHSCTVHAFVLITLIYGYYCFLETSIMGPETRQHCTVCDSGKEIPHGGPLQPGSQLWKHRNCYLWNIWWAWRRGKFCVYCQLLCLATRPCSCSQPFFHWRNPKLIYHIFAALLFQCQWFLSASKRYMKAKCPWCIYETGDRPSCFAPIKVN